MKIKNIVVLRPDRAPMQAEIVSSAGARNIVFQAESEEMITVRDAAIAQKCFDYHPGGYGLYYFKAYSSTTGKHLASWQCSASCD